ncbi:MAG: ClbS/DfsB family four-helix bundle protein [Anaerolineae bacterium]|jgi:hypothetical protein|nr:ClbS/DfsB family four-helix bundle protein [Anaerolineae bacterium]
MAYITTKTDLLAHIERDWAALQRLIDSLTPAQLTTILNADGWRIQDHLAHLAAWHRLVIAFLDRQPPHEALGVPIDLYHRFDLDAINQIIFEREREIPLAQAREKLQATHDAILRQLAPLSDADLNQPYHHYQPQDPELDYPAINVVYGNTAHHYRTHQAWIEQMLSS